MQNAMIADYLWTDHDEWLEAYCLTLVEGLTPELMLRRLQADIEGVTVGITELAKPSFAAWEKHSGQRQFVGVTAVDGWALMIEDNGYIGVTDEISGPLSKDTQLVSHFENVNGVSQFHWWTDETQRLAFDPLFPSQRWGQDPDGQLPAMREIGFDLAETDDDTSSTAAAFALADRLTGTRVTLEMLKGAEFLGGVVTLPD